MAPFPPDGEPHSDPAVAILEEGTLLRGLLTFAAQSAGLRVVLGGSQPDAFFQAIARAPPVLVILGGVSSPSGDPAEGTPPLQLLAWQRAVCPHVPALLLLRRPTEALEARLRAEGAAGVLDTSRADVSQLLAAIREALPVSGGSRPTVLPGLREAPPTASLTPREREVLRMVGEGAANADIAVRLAITERTVRAHVGNLYRKLQVDSRARMALSARALEPQQTSAELERLPPPF
jgi:DNA-binding NarL/FixJ family response regulator